MSHHWAQKVKRPCIWGVIVVAILFIFLLSRHFGVILGTKMGPKSTQGRLWNPIVPAGGPPSAQGCHLARFGARFGISFGSHSVPK